MSDGSGALRYALFEGAGERQRQTECTCILSECVYTRGVDRSVTSGAAHPCRSLGECGAAHMLRRAAEPGGYQVLRRDNPTLDALTAARLVSSRPAEKVDCGTDGWQGTVIVTIKSGA